MRLIDADVLKYALGSSDEAIYFDALIDEMPTIEPQINDWTPCAEGLPEAEDLDTIFDYCKLKRYLITVEYISKVDNFTYVKEVAYVKHFIGIPEREHSGWYDYTSGSWFQTGRVIAWMPKPEPYNPVS